jgi:two-component system, LuxR family, sensor kinase FixL
MRQGERNTLSQPAGALRTLRPYLFAAGAVAAAFAARTLLAPVLVHRAPFLIFVPAVLLAMLYGGRGPALLAGLLSLGAGFSFSAYDPDNYAGSVAEALIFVLVCWGVGAMGR